MPPTRPGGGVPLSPREPGSRRGALGIALLGALLGASWLVLGLATRPIDQTCDPALTRDVCLETIDAAVRRGLPAVHPLLLAAHAEPGPAARPDQFGHRATVTFSLLGIPGTVPVRMFFDAGGHWGGIADRQATELAARTIASAIAVGIAAAAAAAGAGRLVGRSRRSR